MSVSVCVYFCTEMLFVKHFCLFDVFFFGIPFCGQVLNAAWDANIPVASENALTCHDREGYNKILANAKPQNDPDGRHLSAFTYLRLSPVLLEGHNFMEFERFVKKMHGNRTHIV